MKEDLPIKIIETASETVVASVQDRFFIYGVFIFTTLLMLAGCDTRKELINEPLFDGPLLTMDSIYTKMSDSAQLLVILQAARQNDYEGGDREWPEALYLEYMDDDGGVISTFRADYVYFTHKDNLYRAEGNVVVRNIENGDELNTEELFWSPSEKKFYTDRFVTIQSEDEIHTGEGLTANQDFSSYTILKPQGTLLIEDQ